MAEEKKNYNDKDIEKLKKELKEELRKEMFEEMNKENKNNKKSNNKDFEDKVKDTVDKIIDTEDKTKDYDKKDIETNKIIAILSYIGPLCFVPYFVSKESKFAMFHAKQGLNLFVFEAIIGTVSYFSALAFQMSKICGTFGCKTFTPFWITVPLDFIQVILGVISLIGLIYACQGKAKELPILNKIKIIK